VGLSGAVVGRLEHPRGLLRGARQPPRPAGGIGQERIEQLPHDAERELALEVARTGGEHAEARPLGRRAGRAEQPALPDPGGSLNQGQAGPALQRTLDQVLERTELAVAFEELVRRRRPSSRVVADRHHRARYRASRSEISARISSTLSGGTWSMPCSSRACTTTCRRISSSVSPWKVAQHPGTSTPHRNSFTSNLLVWVEANRSPAPRRRG